MTSFIHTCSLSSQIRYGEAFTYNLIDQGSQNTYFNEDITLTIQDPHDVIVEGCRLRDLSSLCIFLIGQRLPSKLKKEKI